MALTSNGKRASQGAGIVIVLLKLPLPPQLTVTVKVPFGKPEKVKVVGDPGDEDTVALTPGSGDKVGVPLQLVVVTVSVFPLAEKLTVGVAIMRAPYFGGRFATAIGSTRKPLTVQTEALRNNPTAEQSGRGNQAIAATSS